MPRAKPKRAPLAIALALVLALLIAWPTWIAMRNGLSDLYARPAIAYLEEKRFVDYQVDQDEWQAIEASVAEANELMPGNPHYLESLGFLHQMQLSMFADELSIEALDVHASKARDFFEQAVAARPTWPYYWGNLALEHYRRGHYGGEEYSEALANAAHFGPWKNDTQKMVADLGSDTWEYLSPQARREFLLNVDRGLSRMPELIGRLVNVYGTWPDICAANARADETLPRIREFCERHRVAQE